MDFGATQSHFLIGSVMLTKVELGDPGTEESGNALCAWPWLASLCTPGQWVHIFLALVCHHPAALCLDLLPSEKQVPPYTWDFAHSGSASSVGRQAPSSRLGQALADAGQCFPKGLSLCSPDCPDLSVFL